MQRLSNFLEKEDCKRVFQEILANIPWFDCSFLEDPVCASSYIYDLRVNDRVKMNVLEDLILVVEAILHSKVRKIIMWRYWNGEDHLCPRSISSGNNLLHLFIGTTRKLILHSEDDDKVYKMANGDAIYVSSNKNTPLANYSVPINNNIASCTIHLCFSVEEPGSFMFMNTATINVLGYGKVPIIYDTRLVSDAITDSTSVLLPRTGAITGIHLDLNQGWNFMNRLGP